MKSPWLRTNSYFYAVIFKKLGGSSSKQIGQSIQAKIAEVRSNLYQTGALFDLSTEEIMRGATNETRQNASASAKLAVAVLEHLLNAGRLPDDLRKKVADLSLDASRSATRVIFGEDGLS